MPNSTFLKMDVKNMVFTLAMFFLFTFIEANRSFFNIIANNPPSPTPSSIVLPIQGSLGIYTATFNIGNPSKPFALLIDTGSDITWVKCEKPPSTNYHKPNQAEYKTHGNIVPSDDPLCAYATKPRNSSSDQCEYFIEYEDESSSSGVLVRDNIHLETLQETSLVFGCGYDLKKEAANYAGILGLDKSKLTILYQLYNLGLIRNVVGHCLREERGYLFFGDMFNSEPRMLWASMSQSSSANHYNLSKVDILFNGESTSIEGLDVIFDSGTALMYLQPEVYEVVRELITNDLKGTPFETGIRYDCFKRDSEEHINSLNDVGGYLKPLALRFPNNVQLQLQPKNYFFRDKDNGTICLGIANSNEHGLKDNYIGAIALRDKLVVYDNERHKIGWVEECPNYDSLYSNLIYDN